MTGEDKIYEIIGLVVGKEPRTYKNSDGGLSLEWNGYSKDKSEKSLTVDFDKDGELEYVSLVLGKREVEVREFETSLEK